MNGADLHIATDTRLADRSDHVQVPRSRHDPCDPWLRMGDQGLMRLPLAGQAGHGCTASLRRQPARIVDGRMEGGYTGVFELICCHCGDHPYLDHAEISHRLQRIRGPYTIEAGLAAYAQHLADRLRY